MSNNSPMNNTIEFYFGEGGLAPDMGVVLRSWYSGAAADDAEQHWRLSAPDGSLWHVLVFGGRISADAARASVHNAVNGLTARVPLNG